MRILFMLSSIAMGGTERNIVSLLPHLRNVGGDIYFCTLNKRRDSPLVDEFSRSGIDRFDLNAVRMVDIAAFRKYIAFLRDQKIDIVHAEDQDSIVYAGLVHFLHGVPTLMTRHVMEEPATTWKTTQRARLVFLSARYGMNHIVAVSEVVRKHFSKQANIPLSKITTIYNGIELERFDARHRRDEIRSGLGWDKERPIALFVSVLRPGKGFDVLFDAIPRIRAKVPDFQVKIVGGGELEADLRRQAVIFGDAVELMGQRMDVPALLGASDLLIQSSWSEALPTVLIEAGAAALPAVATDVGGTKEIVQNGKSGFVVPAGDAEALAEKVTKILMSPDLSQKLGSLAHKFVSKTFSLEKQAKETFSLYERVLKESK